MSEPYALEAGSSRAVFLPGDGARLAELVLDGHHVVLEHAGQAPMWWGAFVMAPWTSLLREGRFAVDGDEYRIQSERDDDLWHGVARRVAWVPDGHRLSADLGLEWPLGGSVWMEPSLQDNALDLIIGITAGAQRMPAAVGWHPWFVRELEGRVAELRVPPHALAQERDEFDVPTGGWVAPTRRWNDCVRSSGEFEVRYGDLGSLHLSTSTEFATLFTTHDDGLCIEPVSSAAERMDDVLEPGATLALTIRVSWTPADLTSQDLDDPRRSDSA